MGERNVRVFEIGKAFVRGEGGHGESWKLSGALSGARRRAAWGEVTEELDYYDGKGIVWALLEALEVDSPEMSCYDCPFLSSDAGAGLTVRGLPVGAFGMVSRDVLGSRGIDSPVFAFELDLDELGALCGEAREFEPLPRYPRVRRDLALVVSEGIEAGAVLKAIAGVGEDLLTGAGLFDVYKGEQLGEGKKSLAFSLTYMSRDRTLTDEEVDAAHGRIVEALVREFRASLRE